jgi:hypothetical protein
MNRIEIISLFLLMFGGVISLSGLYYTKVTIDLDISILLILTGMVIMEMGWIVALQNKIKELEK